MCFLRSILFLFSLIGWKNNFAQADSSITQKARTAFELAHKNSDAALVMAGEALTAATSSNNKSAMAEACNSMGWAWHFKGNYDSSIYYLQKSHTIFTSLKDEYNLLCVKINLAEVYNKQTRFDKAIKILTESDSLATLILKGSDKTVMQKTQKIQNNIQRLFGIVYRETGDYKKSAEYFKLAMAGFLEKGDYFRFNAAASSLSILYNSMNLPDSSIAIGIKSLQIITDYNLGDYAAAYANENLANAYLNKNEFATALEHYTMAYTLFKKLGNISDIAFESFLMGMTLRKMKKYKEAERYLLYAYTINDSLNLPNYTYDASLELATLYQESGNWHKAFDFLKIANQKKDSINLADQMVKTSEIKERYENEKKEVQINLLKEKNKQIKWWYFSVFLALALMSSLLWLRSYKRKVNEEKILNYFATSLYNQNTLEDVFWDISKNCISRLKFEDCVVYSFDEQRNVLVQKSAFGAKNPSGHSILQAIEIPVGNGIVGSVAKNLAPEIIADTRKDPRYIVDDAARRSEIAVPIVLEGRLLGVIDSEHRKKGFYTRRHLRILQKIADICSKKITRHFIEENLRKNIASDLHDDIGSSLSSIDINSRIALIKDDPGKMKEQLEKIRSQARKTMDSMSDIVWSLNPRYDNFENILIRMKQFSSELCEPQHIALHFNIPQKIDSIKLATDQRKNIFLIFKEAVNNVVKYSKSNTLNITITHTNHSLCMKISDDGIGFDPNSIKTGNGLKNMTERAKNINAALSVTSLPQKGTTIELNCPV